jgi:hypothetical protein
VELHADDHADDLTLLVKAWPRIEQAMLDRATGDKVSFQSGESRLLVDAMRRALRVEVQTEEHGLKYVLMFEADSYDGKHAAKYVTAKLEKVEQLAKRHTPHRSPRRLTEVRIVPADEPIKGTVCPRSMTSLRGTPWQGDPDMPPDWQGPW